MPSNVKIDRTGRSGALFRLPRVYEAKDEMDTLTVAAPKVGGRSSGKLQRSTVKDAAGRPLFTDSGRACSIRT